MAAPVDYYKKYRKIALKLVKAECKFTFLKECLKSRVFPMSIYRISIPKECASLKFKFCLMCLRKSIRIARNKKYGVLHELINLENVIYNEDPEMLVNINRGIVKLTDAVHVNLTNKYIKKMKWILKKQASRATKDNPSTFVLWDKVEVPVKIMEFLKWGPNYVPESSNSWDASIQEIERGISGLDPLEKEYLRWKTVIKDRMAWRKGCDAGKYIKLTKCWLRENDLVTTRADKSKTLVIMKRQTYNDALDDYIKKTECERVDEKIIDSVDRRVKKLEKAKITNLLPFLKNCRNPRPGMPRLFAFAKTHKEGKEVRPIVERCRGPTFFLEKRLHRFLTSQLENNVYVAKDPRDVVNEIQDLILMDNEVGTVMDYESLYPSIKIESCKVALLDFMHSKSPGLANYSNDLIELANLVCYESFFAFNGRQYKQKRGVPMGSPMSGLLCELVLRRLEKSVICGFMNDIMYFKRYVDDVLGNNIQRLKWIEKISAFIKKILKLWKRMEGNINEDGGKECFPLLQQFLTSNGVDFSRIMKSIFEEYLSQLITWFEKYFQNDNIDKFAWIQDASAPSAFTAAEEENLIELSCDNTLKTKFSSMELTEFWISVKHEYPLPSGKAQRILIPFATSYLCEAEFVAVIKTKHCTKINVEN
ncbi:uncharacterized protein [Centruroides vittatus]|uniref:uncharacterized protein n=1 Tax=Centruroides vittatus TaxID=120091 RepID=UPI00350FF107